MQTHAQTNQRWCAATPCELIWQGVVGQRWDDARARPSARLGGVCDAINVVVHAHLLHNSRGDEKRKRTPAKTQAHRNKKKAHRQSELSPIQQPRSSVLVGAVLTCCCRLHDMTRGAQYAHAQLEGVTTSTHPTSLNRRRCCDSPRQGRSILEANDHGDDDCGRRRSERANERTNDHKRTNEEATLRCLSKIFRSLVPILYTILYSVLTVVKNTNF